jgi:acyl carrier protein
MITKTQIIECIYDSIDEANIQYGTNLKKDCNTTLFGAESELDSLGLVNIIVDIESAINDKFNVSISIVDEKAMSQKHSPFKTIQSLSDYIYIILNNNDINN